MNSPDWRTPGLSATRPPDRGTAQACLASRDAEAAPDRPETAADAG
ncbi:hypothetical protein [Vannielia litorea]|uniref:Uncharacterized protein n=1 Tax=Vannielia litorea TaxID=1217970 RepID=A0A1N6EPD1_9RHOB|nr:hypothetical protein [Vannielia litorea]SIN84896.1 hypothetical protein SAMN05444002_0984 [Vannielia litorea]